MNNSWESPNKGKSFLQKIGHSLTAGNRWLFPQPEKALERAYEAALMIKEIEQKNFDGQKVAPENSRYSPEIFDCFSSDVNQCLKSIKINITQFRISHVAVESSQYESLEKLRFIDEILTRYQTDESGSLLALTTDSEVKTAIPMTGRISNQDLVSPLLEEDESVVDVTKKRGVLPRSIGRTFQKIRIELDDKSEEQYVQNFRHSRRNTQAAIYTLLLLIIVPLLTQQFSKHILFLPVVNHFRDTHQPTIFINHQMRAEALRELEIFERELKFNGLLDKSPKLRGEEIQEKMQEKANDLAVEFEERSRDAISNVLADFVSLIAFAMVVVTNRRGIGALKTLLNNIIYDLSDSAKAFLIILFTDIFVGYHSPHGWEVILEAVGEHLGIAIDRSAIFLFIATFPVILDTFMKYWIFRYLNQISPSAVATLKNMNE